MRNCTWSSVSFWHFTILFKSAPIRWVTRYLENRSQTKMLLLCKTPERIWKLLSLQKYPEVCAIEIIDLSELSFFEVLKQPCLSWKTVSSSLHLHAQAILSMELYAKKSSCMCTRKHRQPETTFKADLKPSRKHGCFNIWEGKFCLCNFLCKTSLSNALQNSIQHFWD